jgi:hypothetical protein
MDARQSSQRPQSATAQRQDLRAPRIVDDARERPIEVTHYEQWPAGEVRCGKLDCRANLARSARLAALSHAYCSAENSGTTVVIAWMKTSGGAPP